MCTMALWIVIDAAASGCEADVQDEIKAKEAKEPGVPDGGGRGPVQEM